MKVQHDSITYVKQRPERFFTSGSVSAIELATQIASETLLLGGAEVCTIRNGS